MIRLEGLVPDQEDPAELRRLIEVHKRKIESLSYRLNPLKKEVEELTAQVNESLVRIYRAELRLAKLEERVLLVETGRSGRKTSAEDQIEKLVSALSTEKKKLVLELLEATRG